MISTTKLMVKTEKERRGKVGGREGEEQELTHHVVTEIEGEKERKRSEGTEKK